MTFVWLVSYPKSGNTWVRILLTIYRLNEGETFSLGDPLIGNSKHLERHAFDETMGISSSELTQPELESYRLQYHKHFVEKYDGLTFTKSHEAFMSKFGESPIFPAIDKCKAVYLVRNPLDVAVSYAHHERSNIDDIIEHMSDPDAVIRRGEISFNEFATSWSGHVQSWVDQQALPVLVVRYEDLLENTLEAFSRILSFCELEIDTKKLEAAITESRFERLQDQERRTGFKEKPIVATSFFRSGKIGDWRNVLSSKQVDQICSDHGSMMRRFGYL